MSLLMVTRLSPRAARLEVLYLYKPGDVTLNYLYTLSCGYLSYLQGSQIGGFRVTLNVTFRHVT